jgi:hypothetical protein
MPKPLFIILLLLGLTIQTNLAHAQQMQPYKPMTESEWNEAKKGLSEQLLLTVDKITKIQAIIPKYTFNNKLSSAYANQEFILEDLKKYSDTSSLKNLLNHPNKMVRCYAAIITLLYPKIDFTKVIVSHIHDTAFVISPNLNNPIDSTKIRVGDFMIQAMLGYSTYSQFSYNAYESYKKFKTAIPYLITQKNYLGYTFYAYQHALIKNENVQLIIQKAITENNNLALAALANIPLERYQIAQVEIDNLRKIYQDLNDSAIISIFNFLIISTSTFWLSEELRPDDFQNERAKEHYQITAYKSQVKTVANQDTLSSKLKTYCSRQNLIELLNHADKRIQCCAYLLLVKRGDFSPIKTIEEKINEKPVYLVLGNAGLLAPLHKIQIKQYVTWALKHLDQTSKNSLDSFILSYPYDFSFLSSFLPNVSPLQNIKEKIQEQANSTDPIVRYNAILKLAEYQNLSDSGYFITYNKKSRPTNQINYSLNLNAIQKFRHPYFFPYAKRLFNDNLKQNNPSNFQIAFIYPDSIFLPQLKKQFTEEYNKKINPERVWESNLRNYLDCMLGYANTPYLNKAKEIVAISFQYNSEDTLKRHKVLEAISWATFHLTRIYLFDNNHEFNTYGSLEYDTLFKLFYDKKEIEKILWDLWEKQNLITHYEYEYLKRVDKDRCLKLAQQTLKHIFTNTLYFSNEIDFFNDDPNHEVYPNYLALEIAKEKPPLYNELLPIIKTQLQLDLQKQNKLYKPMNLLILCSGTPLHKEAQNIAEIAYKNDLQDTIKYNGIINFYNNELERSNTAWYLPSHNFYSINEIGRNHDSTVLFFYNKQELDSIAMWLWEKEDIYTPAKGFSYDRKNNKHKLPYALQTILNLLNDTSNKYINRTIFLKNKRGAMDGYSYYHLLSEVENNYADTLLQFLDNELKTTLQGLYCIKLIDDNPFWGSYRYLDKLVSKLQHESDLETATLLVYLLNSANQYRKNPNRQLIKDAYKNNKHFKYNINAQIAFKRAFSTKAYTIKSRYHKRFIKYKHPI